jgi:hypothetical protein
MAYSAGSRPRQALVVHLAVAGDADGQQLPVPARLANLQQDVLQGVGPGRARRRSSAPLAQSTSLAMVSVPGVS